MATSLVRKVKRFRALNHGPEKMSCLATKDPPKASRKWDQIMRVKET